MPGTKQISCVSLFDSSYKSVFVASKYMKIYPIGKIPVFVGRIRGCLRFYFTRPFQPVSTDRIAAETDTNRSKSDNTSVLNNGDFRLAIYRGLNVRSETGG